MEITWYGHSCFRITERGMASVVTDPYNYREVGYNPLRLKADIVTISHDSPGHNYISAVKGFIYSITGPGEYEVGGVFITGIQTDGCIKNRTHSSNNTIFVFDYNGLTIAHLGNLKHAPSQVEVEALGSIHIALVPVGKSSSLNASQTSEVISLLEPNIVIPMHYATPRVNVTLDPLSKFLKEMVLVDLKAIPSVKIKSQRNLPDETRVIVLDFKR